MKALFLGAHPDDIEIGCGGTIYKHRNDWEIYTLTFCNTGLNRTHPEVVDCHHQALDILGVPTDHRFVSNMKPSFMYTDRNRVWSTIRDLTFFHFDLVFTHTADDHQDHRTVYEETVRVFQDTSVLCYQIPRSQAVPHGEYYEVLSQEDVERKVAALDCYPIFKQRDTSLGKCFDPAIITAICQTNALYVGERYSENFSVQKIVRR